MLYSEDELLPISAVSQFVHCRRRCALIFIESQWADNVHTAEGTGLHDHVHEVGSETRDDVRKVTGLRLRSLEIGLTGVADVIEYHRIESTDESMECGVVLKGVPGHWIPYPIEYKRGKSRVERCFEVQLCAQSLCLEEMLKTKISKGALYSGAKHHRREIVFDEQIKEDTKRLCQELHSLFERGITPIPEYGKKCNFCSLVDICQPKVSDRQSVSRYIKRMMTEPNEEAA